MLQYREEQKLQRAKHTLQLQDAVKAEQEAKISADEKKMLYDSEHTWREHASTGYNSDV